VKGGKVVQKGQKRLHFSPRRLCPLRISARTTARPVGSPPSLESGYSKTDRVDHIGSDTLDQPLTLAMAPVALGSLIDELITTVAKIDPEQKVPKPALGCGCYTSIDRVV
jgi:hypothetical protein